MNDVWSIPKVEWNKFKACDEGVEIIERNNAFQVNIDSGYTYRTPQEAREYAALVLSAADEADRQEAERDNEDIKKIREAKPALFNYGEEELGLIIDALRAAGWRRG